MVMEGILSGILGNAIKAPGGGFRSTQVPYQLDLVITDGDAAYDTEAEVVAIIGALAAGSVYTKIWEKTVEAQMQMRWGYGSPSQPMNQGYMYFVSLDEGAGFQVGVLRLVQANARETQVYTVKEFNDTRLHGTDSTTSETATVIDKNEMIALPEQTRFKKVGEDSKLQLFYRCVAVATAEDACAFSIPATVYQ
jgi:hypothetical protein